MNKITVDNNWYYKTFFIGKTKLDPSKEYRVSVKWFDKTITEEDLRWKTISGTYGDMGHTYSYTSPQPYIEVNVHGIKLHVHLDALKMAKILQ